MRLRTTAVAFAGAFALVLPVSGQALADGGGTLNYTFFDDGRERRGQLRPAGDSTCYLLNGTSRRNPAVSAFNRTDRAALLFDNDGCSGDPVAVAGPHEGVADFEAVAVRFERPRDKERPPREDQNTGGNGDDVMDGHGDNVDEDTDGMEEADNSRGDEQPPVMEEPAEVIDESRPDASEEEMAEEEQSEEHQSGEEAGEEERAGHRPGGAGNAQPDLFDVIFRDIP
ncbi:hypothetical protein DEJ50_10370 [Streptomyces venezuelae]|uniref:Uncharacterized protein n=1 Tax=Streptomyces venezuelae TaxID=54571 RepID=A0A5P2D1S1_STRVZ|nr:hypothetical protein [Streptomyces venezuelae]QES48157.1 hypothetical protein DEJ50_10370 [Streptomyces venezuelae]